MTERLGSYEILGEAGRGGMGAVFEARHVDTGHAVAVKFLKPGGSADRLAAFENEIRAVALLHHPRVVRVHDFGRLPGALGEFPAETPYFVMEWVPRSVDDLQLPLGWPVVQAVLLEVLDALAHVHARGIVHRDVKPSNVVGVLGRLRLADFGVARMRTEETTETTRRATGTPHYMAPEQFVSSSGPIGPWTDLYAVGCLAHRLVTGEYAFRGNSVVELARHHLQTPFPLEPFSAEFAAWLRRMTAKAPAERYGFAAQAARELAFIEHGFVDESGAPTHRNVPVGDETLPLTTLAFNPFESSAPARTSTSVAAPGGAPTVLLDWRSPHDTTGQTPHIPDGGLEVALLRSPPFVGRLTERDRLWDLLAGVAGRGEARAVWIDGGPGVGKSRLAAWVAERAHELGMARSLVVEPEESFRDAIAHALQLDEDDEYRAEQVAGLTEGWEVVRRRALTRWFAGELELASRRDLVRVVSDALRVLARGTPLVVVVDAVDEGGADKTEVIDALLQDPEDRAWLFLASSSTPYGRFQRWDHIELGPLPETELTWLVRDLVGLEPELSQRVVEQAAGRPGYATSLVSTWVERRSLRNGKHGFALVGDFDELAPPELGAIWELRIEQLVRDFGLQTRPSIELLAAMGSRFGIHEVARAGAQVNLEVSDELLEALVARGFLLRTQRGLRFADESVRRQIADHARQRNTWRSWVGACLHALEEAEPGRRAGWEQEIEAHHRAARSFLEAARLAYDQSRFAEAGRMTARAQRSAERLDEPHASRLLAEARLLRARIWGHERLDAALDAAAEVVVGARAAGWLDLLAASLFLRGRLLRKQIELSAARAAYTEARSAFEALGDLQGVAECDQGLGMCAVAAGQPAEAETLFNRALESHLKRREMTEAGWCANGLGDVYRKRREYDLARSWYTRAANWFEAQGNAYGVMWCVHDTAQADRAGGNFEVAEEGYVRTVALARALGQTNYSARLNLGIVRVQRGRYGEARLPFEEVLQQAELRREAGTAALARICLLPCEAAAGAWDRVERFLDEALPELDGLVDPDLGMMAHIAAEMARAAGQPVAGRLERYAAVHRLEA